MQHLEGIGWHSVSTGGEQGEPHVDLQPCLLQVLKFNVTVFAISLHFRSIFVEHTQEVDVGGIPTFEFAVPKGELMQLELDVQFSLQQMGRTSTSQSTCAPAKAWPTITGKTHTTQKGLASKEPPLTPTPLTSRIALRKSPRDALMESRISTM